MSTLSKPISFDISQIFFWAIPPALLYLYTTLNTLKQKESNNNILLRRSIMCEQNINGETEERTVPIDTFLTFSKNNIPFIHLKVKMPKLCAYEYCVSDSKSNTIQGAYVDSTESNTIVFQIKPDEIYAISLKLATEEKPINRIGFSMIGDIMMSKYNDSIYRKTYSPFCHIIRANDYLTQKGAKNNELRMETTLEETNTKNESEDICSISGINFAMMSQKRRQQYKKYMSGFRKASNKEICAAIKIQSVIRGYRERCIFRRKHEAAIKIQRMYRSKSVKGICDTDDEELVFI